MAILFCQVHNHDTLVLQHVTGGAEAEGEGAAGAESSLMSTRKGATTSHVRSGAKSQA